MNREKYSKWLIEHGKHDLYQVYAEYFSHEENSLLAVRYDRIEFIQTWINNEQLARYMYTEMFNAAMEEERLHIVRLLKDMVDPSLLLKSLNLTLQREQIGLFRELTRNFDLLEKPAVFLPLLRQALFMGQECFVAEELEQLWQSGKHPIFFAVVSLCCTIDIWPEGKSPTSDILSDAGQYEKAACRLHGEKTDFLKLFKRQCRQNLFFVAQTSLEILSQEQKSLNEAYLVACKFGALGLVRIAVAKGADIHHWINFGMRFANQSSNPALKHYLLDLGMKDETF